MLLISCEINLILNWSANCVISSNATANETATFKIADTNIYAPVVTLPTDANAKLLQQLKSGFKHGIDWNKNQTKITWQMQNQYLDY